MIKRILLATTFGLVLFSEGMYAQNLTQKDSISIASTLDYKTPETYEIGGIEVQGAVYTDANGIIAITGFSLGQTIRIPSDQIGKAIRNLWKQRLFVDVAINIKNKVGDIVFLEIVVQEYPRFARHGYKGIPKGQHDDANAAVHQYLQKGRAATPAMKYAAINALKELYIEKGFLDVAIEVEEREDALLKNSIRWTFNITKGKRVRIERINFHGLKSAKEGVLYRSMKETKRNNFWALFKPSKFIKKAYETDKNSLIAYYNSIGHRDAMIVKDSVYFVQKKNRKTLQIDVYIAEGNSYHFGAINFKGNTIYPNSVLHQVLGIDKGAVYDKDLFTTRLEFDKNGRDLKTLYMDNGYLFFRANPVEKGIRGDSIDYEVRIVEGPIARIGNVTISGNTKTSEHVIRRALRTLPGNRFSRSDLIRSQRELAALNYFDPETMQINTPVNAARGTVDIEYVLDEKTSDQIELSAGWGGTTVFGTAGVKLTNFSLRKFFQPKLWNNGMPVGDGQTLSFRIQTNGPAFQSYNLSFTEPWLGGKKPNSLTFSAYYSNFTNGYTEESSALRRLQVTGATIGWGTRLKFPDDFFVYQASLNYKKMDLLRWQDLNIPSGTYHNLSFNQTISRNSLDNTIFPTKGANIALNLSLTLPYSLLAGHNNSEVSTTDELVEYHKWDFTSEWYGKLAKNFVLKLGVKMGFLGYYNPNKGPTAFDRYELGGNGLSNPQTVQGRDIISMRGYEVGDLSANGDGAAIYNKFSVEFRYLISPSPTATIWALAFVEAGDVWSDAKRYNPFKMRRTAGVGVRVFLPMFGTLGLDYGIGFDKPNLDGVKDITKYGTFNIVLGVEPK
ncbi:MAG: Outer membrane protein assembly factor YaeT precursor [uncultured Aureispira sp.]|uniref:Outer membrane protein assembly factor BamA n=1 Tax=uncultured Aureispira sp. TaxID=1331704 RepID=A0A6S6SEZ2_9BACT|nr:MAG: Outer membrane protein assembly factor YaeT precursor [uncultured Aureispira sp.]